jgi:nitrilase
LSAIGLVRAAAIQMKSGADVQHNLQTIDGLLMDASARGVAIAFLPENLAIMGVRDEDKLAHSEDPGSGPIQEFLADAARRHKLWVVAGSLPLKSPQDGKCYGASIVYDSEGNASPIYRKIHLFDVDLPGRDERYRESATMDYGDDPVVVPSPLGQLGLSICYDLRFPELYRRLVDDGASIFSIPAAFTATTGKAWISSQRPPDIWAFGDRRSLGTGSRGTGDRRRHCRCRHRHRVAGQTTNGISGAGASQALTRTGQI